jgi:hypothetical protein
MCESEERVGALFERLGDAHPSSRVERFSAFGDGPKYVCGLDVLATRPCLISSIGSHNEFGFEKALKSFLPHCEIHTFDPTLTVNSFLGSAYSKFYDSGLGNARTDGPVRAHSWTAKLRPLDVLMRQLNHTGRTLDILKIDCESCEWHSLAEVFHDVVKGAVRIGQLQVEMHLMRRTSQADVHAFMANADNAGFRVFHKEPNVLHGDGFTTIEYAFVHRAFACAAFIQTHCPGVGRASQICQRVGAKLYARMA